MSVGTDEGASDERNLALARASLKDLLDDRRVPQEVRDALATDYAEIEAMLDRLEHGHVHIAVFGRVSVGKSSLLNALLGEAKFSVSPLHGETRTVARDQWRQYTAGGVFLIDTPGINEVGGEEREQLAREVAGRADLVLFVVEGDITASEADALRVIAGDGRPVLLILNKADRYTPEERQALMRTLAQRTDGLVDPTNILAASAQPSPRTYVHVGEDGSEVETVRRPEPDMAAVKDRLWAVLESEGKTLAALNAGLFAGRLTDRVAERILATRQKLGERVIRTYCVSKGVAVALNPVPVADLAAAAFIDGAMVLHLSRLYDLPLTRAEAGTLVKAIVTALAALMGTVWAVHLVSSALKAGTGGVSTVVTAGAQGAVAYYSTFVVGKAAESYLVQGKSWGDGGPKQVVRDILDSLDRESILAQGRDEIRAHLKGRSRSV